MGCYFGCSSPGARCSWAFWVVFLLAGAGCLVGFGLTAVGCGVEVVACGEDNGLALPQEQQVNFSSPRPSCLRLPAKAAS